MSPVSRPLPPQRLNANWPPERIPWETSDAIPRNGRRKPAQPRVLQALELALHIRTEGYNVYLAGESDLGRTYMLRDFLTPRARRGLSGEQGVIIPRDNVEHLMLESKVVETVRQGRFAIYPVTHISEALELLTGLPTGRRRKDGTFPKGSLFRLVDDRLHELGWLAEHSFKTRRRKG